MKEESSPRLKSLRPGVILVTGSLLNTKNKVSFTRLQCRSPICGTNLTFFFPNVTIFVWCGDTLPFNVLVTSAGIPQAQRKHDMRFKLDTIHSSSSESYMSKKSNKMHVILLQLYLFQSGKSCVMNNISAFPLDTFALHYVDLGNANKSHFQHYSHYGLAFILKWLHFSSSATCEHLHLGKAVFIRPVLCRGRSVCHNELALTSFSMKGFIFNYWDVSA